MAPLPGMSLQIGMETMTLWCIRISNGILPPPPPGKAMRPACFLRILKSTFYLYTVHMCSIVGDKSWHFYPYPLGRGGSYGASGGHLRTSGSQRHGALPCDRGAPGDLSRLTRGRPRGHRLASLCPARVLRLSAMWYPGARVSPARL